MAAGAVFCAGAARAKVGATVVRATAATVATTVARLKRENVPLFTNISGSSLCELGQITLEMGIGFPFRNPSEQAKRRRPRSSTIQVTVDIIGLAHLPALVSP
jgi:hypothetical protein